MTETVLDRTQEQRTFVLGAMDGMLVRMYSSLIDPSLVLTWFVTQLSSSPLAVALLLPLARGGYMLPQLFACGFVQRQPRKMPLYRRASAVSVLAWGLATALVFLLGARQPGLLLAAFFVLFFVCYLAMGTAGLPFMDIVGKGISPGRRTTFFAWRDFGGSLLALAGSALARFLLDARRGLAFPYNFGLVFVVAGVLMASAYSLFAQIEERIEAVPAIGASTTINLGNMLAILRRDRNFMLYILARVTLTLHTIALPFYTVFAKERLGAPVDMAGLYLGAYTGATLLSSLVWGRIGDMRGNRAVLLASALLGLPCPLVPLLLGGRLTYPQMMPLFALLGLTEGGIHVAVMSFVLDLAPPAQRTVYVGLTSTVMGLTNLSLVASGWLAARWGMEAVFAAAAAVSLLSPLLLWPIRDPRAIKVQRR